MDFSSADISDYVSGRLDEVDRIRLERALNADPALMQDVDRARQIKNAVKAKFRVPRAGHRMI